MNKRNNIAVILVIAAVLIIGAWLLYKSGGIDIPGFRIQAYEDTIISPEDMREDLDYIVKTLREVHPKTYIDFTAEQKQIIEYAYNKINTPMTIADFYFIANEIIASMGDAHTSMYMQSGSNSRLINLNIIWLKDGMYVGDDAGELKKGDKIISIGGKSENEIFLLLEKIIPSENEQWIKVIGSRFLIMEPYLKYLGLLSQNRVSIVAERNGIRISSSLAVVRKGIRIDLGRKNWISYSIDKETSLGILKLDQCIYNDEYSSTLKRFFTDISRNNIKNIAIDIRNNLGGNSMVIDEFISYLAIEKYTPFTGDIRFSTQASEQTGLDKSEGYESFPHEMVVNKKVENTGLIFKGDVYILTSASTFSSANWFAVIFKDNKMGRIIGEPTGNQPSSYGDVLVFDTPNADFTFQVSYKKWIRPDPSRDPENCLEPDTFVYTKIEDIISGKDPQLDKLKEIIGDHN